jgi:polyferredoxin
MMNIVSVIIILIAILAFGRKICGKVCPVGLLQDLIEFM